MLRKGAQRIKIPPPPPRFETVVGSFYTVFEVYSEVNINHETTTMVLWIYDGIE